MRIRSPSLHELHAFAAIARLGSFSRAAEALCVTQGAVSRAVARLEDHLGQPLLVRGGRRSELTDAGRAYLAEIAPAIDRIESATVALSARRSGEPLRVSVIPTLASHWLIPRLPDFHARHPGIALSFVPYRRDDPLDSPGIDAWLRSGDGRWPAHIAADYVVGREIVPICRPDDAAAIRRPADLLRRPLLFHTNYPDNWRHWFAQAGVEAPPLAPAAQFDQVAMLVQGVIAGLGVAVVQRCLIEDDLANGRVAVAIDRPVDTARGYWLCCRRGERERAPLAALRTWLLASATAARDADNSTARSNTAATRRGPNR